MIQQSNFSKHATTYSSTTRKDSFTSLRLKPETLENVTLYRNTTLSLESKVIVGKELIITSY